MAAYCDSPVMLKLALANGPTVDLMDAAQGFRLEELDLGYPEVREDVDLLPQRHGVVDFTRYFGARAVTISGALVPSAAGSRQKAAHALAPFLDPAARATLTYQVDADVSPRTLTVRPSLLSAPFSHPKVSAVSLAFKCPDPLAYDTVQRLAVVHVTGAGSPGRAYNLVFPRVYPAGGAGSAIAYNYGDFTAYPVLRFYGPITGPLANFQPFLGGAMQAISTLQFQPSYAIPAGHFVEVNTRTRSVLLDGDPQQPQTQYLVPDRNAGGWPYLLPGAPSSYTQISLQGSLIGSATQLVVAWADPYLL